jgi:hypothetical protein
MDKNLLTDKKKTAANERFCEMAAVTPQTILCEFERLSPAVSAVEAATSQSRRHVIGNRVKCVVLK